MDFVARRERLKGEMAEHSVECLAVMPGPNMAYLLGYHPHVDERPCYLLVSPVGEALVVPELNAAEVSARVALPVYVYPDGEAPEGALRDALREVGAARARHLLVEEAMRFDFVSWLRRVLPEASLEPDTVLLNRLRSRKDEEEIALLRENAAQADAVLEEAFSSIEVGMTERQLALRVETSFRAKGASPLFAIVAAGPNSAYPHHQSGDGPLGHGQPVLLDVGAAYRGYTSDCTRMAYLGTPDPAYVEVQAVVEEAVEAALAAIRPGVPAHLVDQAARRVIAARGYGPFFTHRLGHGIGITGHEAPFLSPSTSTTLEVGMVFSVEPGIYLPGRFGVRLEEIVVVRPTGPEVLSRLDRRLRVLDG